VLQLLVSALETCAKTLCYYVRRHIEYSHAVRRLQGFTVITVTLEAVINHDSHIRNSRPQRCSPPTMAGEADGAQVGLQRVFYAVGVIFGVNEWQCSPNICNPKIAYSSSTRYGLVNLTKGKYIGTSACSPIPASRHLCSK
jgi:hypothetical protein